MGRAMSLLGENSLEKIACQHAIFVRAHALLCLSTFRIQSGGVRVFDNLELVLLVRVEEAVEGVGREEKGFGDERCKFR